MSFLFRLVHEIIHELQTAVLRTIAFDLVFYQIQPIHSGVGCDVKLFSGYNRNYLSESILITIRLPFFT